MPTNGLVTWRCTNSMCGHPNILAKYRPVPGTHIEAKCPSCNVYYVIEVASSAFYMSASVSANIVDGSTWATRLPPP